MFDLYNRTVLHTFGEVVNPYRFQPSLPSEEMILGHDFLSSNLRQTSWLHRRCDVDYNGWWMCLIPTAGDPGDRSLPSGVHQMGRCGIRPPGKGTWLPDSFSARARPCGTCRGSTRTTLLAGRPTSTPVTVWWPRSCTALTSMAAGWSASRSTCRREAPGLHAVRHSAGPPVGARGRSQGS